MFNTLYNPQATANRIDNQIAELQKMKEQLGQQIQPTNLTQNFQLTSNQNGIRYVDNVEEVNRTLVYTDTLFISKDFSNLWLKGSNGTVRTFILSELVEKDEKDLKIENLQKELEKLKGSISNEQFNEDDNESISTKKPTTTRTSKANNKLDKSTKTE